MKIIAGIQLIIAVVITLLVYLVVSIGPNQDSLELDEALRNMLLVWVFFLSIGYILISLLTATSVLFSKNKQI